MIPGQSGAKHSLGAIAFGVLAATGPIGSAGAAAMLLCGAVWVLGWNGVLVCIASRPLVDTFWHFRFLSSGDRLWNLQSIVGVAVPLTLITACVLRPRGLRFEGVSKWFCFYAAASLIGTILGTPTHDAYSDYLRLTLPFAFYLAAFRYASERLIIALPSFVLATYGLLPAASGVLQMIGVLEPIEGAVTTSSDWVVRATGLYHHPYDISIRCMISLPFALFLSKHLGNRTARIAMVGWAVVLALVAVLTLVRSTMAAILLVLVTWFWIGKRRRLALLAVCSPILLIALVAPLRTVLGDAIRPISSGAWEQLGTGRAVLFVAQVSAFEDASVLQKAVGRGLHTTPELTERFSPLEHVREGLRSYGSGNAGAHNQYLRVLGESGVLGLTALIGLIVASISACVRVRTRSTSPTADFASSTMVLILALLVVGVSFQPFDQPAVMWPVWLAVGIVVGTEARGGFERPAQHAH